MMIKPLYAANAKKNRLGMIFLHAIYITMEIIRGVWRICIVMYSKHTVHKQTLKCHRWHSHIQLKYLVCIHFQLFRDSFDGLNSTADCLLAHITDSNINASRNCK